MKNIIETVYAYIGAGHQTLKEYFSPSKAKPVNNG